MKLLAAVSISSQVLSFGLISTMSRIILLYVSQRVCEVCSLGGGCRTMTVVLIVAMIGE